MSLSINIESTVTPKQLTLITRMVTTRHNKGWSIRVTESLVSYGVVNVLLSKGKTKVTYMLQPDGTYTVY